MELQRFSTGGNLKWHMVKRQQITSWLGSALQALRNTHSGHSGYAHLTLSSFKTRIVYHVDGSNPSSVPSKERIRVNTIRVGTNPLLASSY